MALHSTPSLSASTMGTSLLTDSIDHAAWSLDQALQEDRTYLDLSDLLQIPKHSKETTGYHGC